MSETPQKTDSGQPESEGRKGYIIKTGGLYHNVNVSPRLVEALIVVLIVLMISLIVYGAKNGGYTVTFDSNGGTDVAEQRLEYGDSILQPYPPTREGYTFGGWYTDEGLSESWDFDTMTVGDSMTLYAAWIPAAEKTESAASAETAVSAEPAPAAEPDPTAAPTPTAPPTSTVGPASSEEPASSGEASSEEPASSKETAAIGTPAPQMGRDVFYK